MLKILVCASALLSVLAFPTGSVADPMERTSVTADGEEADGPSFLPVVSATGRFVIFTSEATNLVEGDTNGHADVFLKDRETGLVELISVATDGTLGDADSGILGGAVNQTRPSVTPDGRFVVFASEAQNLDSADLLGLSDIFVRDREAQTTELLSFDADGNDSAPFVSGKTAISDDGRFVLYHSVDSSFDQAGDVAFVDALLRDREEGTTTLLSVNSSGEQATSDNPSSANISRGDISADGRFVAFDSRARNLVSDDTNDQMDVFRRDLLDGLTIRVSLADDGSQLDGGSALGGMDASGQYIFFLSDVVDPADPDERRYFLRDIETGTTSQVTLPADNPQMVPGAILAAGHGQNLSAGGRFAVFASSQNDLVGGDENELADVFRYETATGEVTLLSDSIAGGSGNDVSETPAISDDGRVVVFASDASDLVPEDTNDVSDIFATGDILRAAHPYEYAAKVVCGTQDDPEGLSLTPGRYATTVNIHSPTGNAQFSKKMALGIPPGRQAVGEIKYISVHELGYDEVLSTDCTDIRARLFPNGFPVPEGSDDGFIEGFLVIESEAPLDVVAVYSTADLTDSDLARNQSSIDVERIPERRRLVDVSVTKTVSTLVLPITDGAELFLALFTVTVANSGPDIAPDVALHDVMALEVSNALAIAAFVVDEPALINLPPGASVTDSSLSSATLSTLDIDLGDIPAGESVIVEFWAVGQILTVGFTDPSVVLKDTVSVSSAGVDEASGNGTSTLETTLHQ